MLEKASPGQRLFRVFLFGFAGLVVGIIVAIVLESFGEEFDHYYLFGMVVYGILLGAGTINGLLSGPYLGRIFLAYVATSASLFGASLIGLSQGSSIGALIGFGVLTVVCLGLYLMFTRNPKY